MSDDGVSGNLVPILYLVPFLASAAYGLYLWAGSGLSAFLPTTVYLGVTRDPYVFAVGTLAVLLGVALDVSSAAPQARAAKVKSVSDLLMSIAVASVVLSLLGAFYSNGFAHFSQTATDFIVGRYSIVFPAMLVLLSYLVTIRLNVKSLANSRLIGVILMLVSPAAVYEVGKRYTALGVGLGLVLVVAGIVLFFRIGMRERRSKEP